MNCSLGASTAEQSESAKTFTVLEMQGTLVVPEALEDQESSNHRIYIGELKPPETGSKSTFRIEGSLIIEGDRILLKKPMLLLRKHDGASTSATRKRPRNDGEEEFATSSSCLMDAVRPSSVCSSFLITSNTPMSLLDSSLPDPEGSPATGYEIAGVVKEKYLFKAKPVRETAKLRT